ncbi:MAG: beta-hydroxyacyl-ACP dehydratase [Sedimentisphaerales bacterium]|nr:beta-hydroxyacyl-ACP dehydratase [Sedimentisphaerales bacterium]MBN2842336.1 beta-hydroxyacyl-ACP dehydratase [Sedimentisphaerales bacterium]
MRWIWIDKFTEFEPGKRAVSLKNVTLAEEHLHDHFPGYPTMPASIMIEAMAQTGGILVGYERKFKEKVILAKINKATFYEIVRPGESLILEAVIDNIADEAASITGTIKSGDTLVADIKMMFSHIDNNMAGLEFPQENFVFNDQFLGLLRFYLPADVVI